MHLFNLSLYRLVAVIQLKVHFKENASSKRTMDFEPSIGLETNIHHLKLIAIRKLTKTNYYKYIIRVPLYIK